MAGVVRGRIIFANGRSSNFDWRVSNGRIIDVNVRGIWLTLQLREQFNRVLVRSKGDFAALFRFLRTG
jgi:ABC-type transporter MlaC component